MGDVLEEWKRYASARHEVAMQGLLAAPLCSFLSCCVPRGYVGYVLATETGHKAHIVWVTKGPMTHNIQLAVPISQCVTQGSIACAIQFSLPISQ